MIDLIECENVFAYHKESERTKEHKRIKNIIMNIILNDIRLSNREVEIYKLYYRENLSHDEIAVALDITPKTSMNHLSRANFKISMLSNDIANNFKKTNNENEKIEKIKQLQMFK